MKKRSSVKSIRALANGYNALPTTADKESAVYATFDLLVAAGEDAIEVYEELKKLDAGLYSQAAYDGYLATGGSPTNAAVPPPRSNFDRNKASEWIKENGVLLIVVVILTSIVNHIYAVVTALVNGGAMVYGNPYLQFGCFLIICVVALWAMKVQDLKPNGQVLYASLLLLGAISYMSTFWMQVLQPNSSAPIQTVTTETSKPNEAAEAATVAVTVPPRPQIAGKDLSDKDMYVISQKSQAGAFAFYGLVRREWDMPHVPGTERDAVILWMENWYNTLEPVTAGEIKARTEQLVKIGGAKGIDDDGKIILYPDQSVLDLAKILNDLGE